MKQKNDHVEISVIIQGAPIINGGYVVASEDYVFA